MGPTDRGGEGRADRRDRQPGQRARNHVDPYIAKVITRARKGNVKLVAYIGTQYTRKSLDVVRREVDTYSSSTPRSRAFISTSRAAARKTLITTPIFIATCEHIPDALVLNNPGSVCAEYLARPAADVVCLFERDVFGDERLINPFPKPLAPRGYVMVEVPIVRPEVTLQYLIFDFGKREANVDSAKEEKLAAGADVIQVNQALAFRVASAYYQLMTAQERLQAAQDTLRTAQTTQDAAENRLDNGLATLPDVLNAQAETSQAVFDEESADGDEKVARVTLTEAVGADPSPNIVITARRVRRCRRTHNVHRGADRSRDEGSS